MSKTTIIFNDQGLPVGEAPPPPENHVVFPAGTPHRDTDGRWLAPDGSYRWWLIGQPCYGGLDGRTAMPVPDDAGFIGKSWSDLAALTSAGHPYGLLKDPRPLTKAEQAARAKAEADAKAQADAAALAALEISAVQARLAANEMGIRDDIERVVSAPATDRAVKDLWEYSTTFKRSHPLWERFAPLIGKTSADIDAFFKLARTK